jgi:hypothetical protein
VAVQASPAVRPRAARPARDASRLRRLAERVEAWDADARNNLGVLYFNQELYD